MTATVSDALELEPVESHLHPEGSFVVDDHAVPTGLEEIWRFTPLKRLRGLHQDTPLDGDDFTVETDAAPGVTAVSVPVADSARGASGYVPVDRVSARAWEAATSVFEVTIPKDAIVDEPTTVRLKGGRPRARHRRSPARARRCAQQGRRRSSTTPARPPGPRTSRSCSRTAPN